MGCGRTAAFGSVALMGSVMLAACGPKLVPPPAYPWAGFGRVGCYAGPALARGFRGNPRPSEDVASTGPWLVLDSVTVAELRHAGYEDPISGDWGRSGVLLERVDTVEVTYGRWHRIQPDSLVFDEGTAFPPVTWRFEVGSAGMVGEGSLVSDAIFRGPDGIERPRTRRWPVHVAPIPCEEIPTPEALRGRNAGE